MSIVGKKSGSTNPPVAGTKPFAPVCFILFLSERGVSWKSQWKSQNHNVRHVRLARGWLLGLVLGLVFGLVFGLVLEGASRWSNCWS